MVAVYTGTAEGAATAPPSPTATVGPSSISSYTKRPPRRYEKSAARKTRPADTQKTVSSATTNGVPIMVGKKCVLVMLLLTAAGNCDREVGGIIVCIGL